MPHKSTGSGIYCIRNLLNDKVYIGQAARLERRLYEHKYYLGIGKDKCVALQRAVSKYGLENFEFSILEYCSTNELNDKEIFYIQEYRSNDRHYGYNISSGGGSGLIGHVWPKWFGEKVSQAKKAQGKKMTPEQREFIISVNKGKFVSDETRKRISEATTGKNHPMWGKSHSDESRAKMSESKKGNNSYQFGKKMPNSSSKYFGVYPLKSKGYLYWTAQIKQGKTHVYIGSSKDEEVAARMYDKFVVENGLPNPLNFPEEWNQ